MGWFPNTPSGLNRYVYELLYQLSIDQDSIELCGVGLPENAPDIPFTLTNLASPVTRLPHRLWSVYRQFSHRYHRSPDAINLHFALYSLPLINQFPKDVPVTFNFHGPWALESLWEGENQATVLFKQWVERQVYHRCDRLIVLSKTFGTMLHEQYEIPWEKIFIIPGGVNTVRFQPHLSRREARTQLGWHSDRRILFTPRRLVHRMGLDKLLTAMVEVKNRVPDVWLAIAGKGSLHETLERQIRELDLSNHVQLLGYVPDEQLPIAYQAADLTVVPSQNLEGFGLILLESLACGTPVVCTPVGGMPEVVAPFCPDLVTESTDVTAISKHLVTLLKEDHLLPDRKACREYAVTHYDWRVISQKVRKVLLDQTR